jgi:catechol 2,3-dioxygenase-like lactoylglutathione lyase family enzyme
MLQVPDVEASSRWYQEALGLQSGHGGAEFEMLMDEGELVLQLHRLDAHEHGFLQPAPDVPRGAGVSLWFECADRAAFEAKLEQARAVGATILEDAHWNPLAHHHEATLTDLDGYLIALHSPFEPPG